MQLGGLITVTRQAPEIGSFTGARSLQELEINTRHG